jgi:RNA polymerase sigma-70 factor (ECF subfamily)
MIMDRDERAFFDRVYTDSFPVLFRVVFRITGDEDVAEELCHEAFIRLYENSRRLPDTDQARYWLLRVGKNLAFNHSKRRGRERTANQRVYHEPARPVDSADAPMLRRETEQLVRAAVERLPSNLRDVIVLKEYGDLSYVEISRTLKISVGNVKVRVHRARERLARILEEADVHFPE